LAVRRIREIFNSTGRNVPALRRRAPYNLAFMNPDDLNSLGIADGEKVTVTSDYATIPAKVASDPTVRRGVVSMTHGFGSLPGQTLYERDGSSTSMLISTDRDLDPLNAMPRMSAIPVSIARTNAAPGVVEATNLEHLSRAHQAADAAPARVAAELEG
jgi:anaerobic selenocysteine-containing dehydrogenase